MTTSELTISDQSLTFPKTVPGKPVFLVLRIATDEKNITVTASTDLPTVFQLASDDRPIFGSLLALASEPSGTYIHIRYQPDRAGIHESTLTLQSAVGTRTVSLTGRCTRLSAVHTNPNNVLTRTVASRDMKPGIQRTGMMIAGGAVFVALLYTGVAYRCQLLPSLCQQDAAVNAQPVVNSAPPVVDVPVPASVPVRTVPVKPAVDQSVTKAADRSRQKEIQTSGEERNEKTVRIVEPTPTVAVKPAVSANQSATRSAIAKSARVEKTQAAPPARPAKSVVETEESDLERELNGRTNQNR